MPYETARYQVTLEIVVRDNGLTVQRREQKILVDAPTRDEAGLSAALYLGRQLRGAEINIKQVQEW